MSNVEADLKAAADSKRAEISQRFFKTGKGEYGEGDIFIGLRVPTQRAIAKKYYNLPLGDVEKLMQSPIHEFRLTGSIILVEQYKRGDDKTKQQIYNFYLANTKFFNNWDIVDGSAPYIVGPWLKDKDKSVLTKLAKSKSIWERRISMLSTFAYIKDGNNDDALKMATVLVNDPEDLIQKAVGWMLREIGNHSGIEAEEEFLEKHYQTMPRTMLRYAIEKFPAGKKAYYMKKA